MRFRKALKIAVAAGGALVILLLLALVAVSFVDANRYRGFVARQVEAATGRHVELTGDLRLSLWPLTPTVEVQGVRFSNASWSSHPDMITVKRGQVSVALLPLLRGQVRVERLVLIEPTILLETAPSGLGNWVLDRGTSAEVSRPESQGPGTGGVPFDIGEIRVEGASLTFHDGVRGQTTTATIERLAVREEGDQDLRVEMIGAYNAAPVTLHGTLGRIPTLLANQGLAIRLTVTAGGVEAGLDGAIARPLEGRGIEVALTLAARSLVGLSGLTGAELLPIGPVELKATLSDAQGVYALRHLVAAVGKSDLSGEIAVAFGGARPTLSARLAARRLDLQDFVTPVHDGPQSSHPQQEPAPAEGPARAEGAAIVSTHPLPLAWLRRVDADVTATIDRLVFQDATFESVKLALALTDGRLQVAPLEVRVGRGRLAGTLSLDARTEEVELSTTIDLARVELGRLLADLGVPRLVHGGDTDVRLSVTGKGGTARAIVESLTGRLDLTIRRARLSGAAANALAVERLGLVWEAGAELAVELIATFHDHPVKVAGTLGSPQTLLTGGEYPVKLTAETDGATLTVDGALARPLEGSGISLALGMTAESLAGLSGLARTELPALGPLKATTRVSGADGTYTLGDLAVTLGQSDVSGNLTVVLGGTRPKISASLASKYLDIGDLTAAAPAPPVETGGLGPPNARAEPPESASGEPLARLLKFRGLRAADAEVTLTVDRLVAEGTSLENIDLTLSLREGRLRVEPIRADLAGGTLTADLSVDASAEVTRVSTALHARQIGLGAVLQAFRLPALVAADRSDLALQLAGEGDSVHALLEGLTGSLRLSSGESRIHDAVGIERLTLSRTPDGDGNVALELQTRYNGQAVEVVGDLGPIATLVANERYRIDATVTAAGAKATLVGAVGHPLDGTGVELALGLTIPSLADLSRVAGADLPALGPIEARTRLSGGGEAYTLRDFKARVGSSELSGELTVGLGGARPTVWANLASRRLDLADFTPPPDDAPTSGRRWSGGETGMPAPSPAASNDDPLPLQGLRAVDAELTVAVDELLAHGLIVTHVSLETSLTDGRLRLKSANAELGGGAVAAAATLTATGDMLDVASTIDIAGVQLERLLGTLDEARRPTGGHTDGRIELAAFGASTRALLTSLTGRFDVAVGPTRFGATALVDGLSLRWDGGPRLGLEVSAHYHDQPLRAVGTLGSPAALFGDGDYPIRLTVDAGTAALSVDGVIARPLAGTGINVVLALTADSLAGLSGLARTTLPAIGPLDVTTRLLDGEDTYTFRELSARVGDSELTGEVTVQVANPRPRVSAHLAARRLALEDLLPRAPDPQTAAGAGDTSRVGPGPEPRPLLSDAPLPLWGVRSVDADLTLGVDRFSAAGVDVQAVTVGLSLADGQLRIEPLRATLDGGVLVADLSLDARTDRLALSADVKASQLGLAALLEKLEFPEVLMGDRTDLTLRLTAAGSSVRALVEGLTGNLELTMDGARLYDRLAIEHVGLSLPPGASGRPRLTVTGSSGGQPVNARATIGSLTALLANDGYRIELTVAAGGAELTAVGAVARPLQGRGIDVELGLTAASLEELSHMARTALLDTGPVEVRGRLSDADGAYALRGLVAKIGQSDLSGDVRVALTGPRPEVSLNVRSGRLDLADLGILAADGPRDPGPAKVASSPAAGSNGGGDAAAPEIPKAPEAEANDARLIPAARLPLEVLRSLDVEVSWKIDRLRTRGVVADDLDLRLGLEDGKLRVGPVRTRLAGGTLAAELEVDAAARITTTVDASQVDLGRLFDELQFQKWLDGGKTDVTVRLSSTGETVRELVAGLDGRVVVAVGEGRLQGRMLELAGTDVLAGVLRAINPFAKSEDHTVLQCGAFDVEFGNGVAVANKGIGVETQRVTVAGSGTVNLETEDLEVVIRPRARRGMGLGTGDLTQLVAIGGTLARPKLEVNLVGTLRKGVEVGGTVAAALFTAGLSLVAQGAIVTLWQNLVSAHPCADVLGQDGTSAAESGAARPRPEVEGESKPPSAQRGAPGRDAANGTSP